MATKSAISDLAFLGGPPYFSEPLHVGQPNLVEPDQFRTRINEILDRRWFTNDGTCVQEFEQRIAQYLGVAHCVAICNGTVALEILIRALGLTGEVIVPSFTFVATAHALQWQGITPVFCDIDPSTHNLNPDQIPSLITSRTSAILGVHVWGRPCDVDALGRLGEQHGLDVLFDAAHAFGCSQGGQMIGSNGRAEVFSFHATKFVNAIEGGAITTNDAQLADQLRLMRNFGFSGYDQVESVGTNGKMNEFSAAMGLTCLDSLQTLLEVNHRNDKLYRGFLSDIPGVSLIDYPATERHNRQYIVLEIDADTVGLSRDQLQKLLTAENVLARRYFYPGCHRMEPYRSLYPDAGRSLRVTEALADRVLLLPTGTCIGHDQIESVGEILSFCIDHALEIRRLL